MQAALPEDAVLAHYFQFDLQPFEHLNLFFVLCTWIGPHCRTSYEDGPQEELYERLTALAEQRQLQQHQEVQIIPPSPPRPSHQFYSTSPPSSDMVRRQDIETSIPPSPGRNLHIEEESLWPGLSPAQKHRGAVPRPEPSSRRTPQRAPAPAAQHHHLPAPPPVSLPSGPETPSYGGVGGYTNSSSASGVLTASGTPPSPANTVMVSYHGAARAAPGMDPVSTAGECVVVLRGSTTAVSGMNNGIAHSDSEGAALLASLKLAVSGGTLSLRQAARAVAQNLKERSERPGKLAVQSLGSGASGASDSGIGGSYSNGGAAPRSGLSLWGEAPLQEASAPSLFSGWELDSDMSGLGLGSHAQTQQAYVVSSNGDSGGVLGYNDPPVVMGEVRSAFPPSSLELSMRSSSGAGSRVVRGPPPGFGGGLPQQELQSSMFLQTEYATGMR